MIYEWKTLKGYGRNHLIDNSGYWLCSNNRVYFRPEERAKYYADKIYCCLCTELSKNPNIQVMATIKTKTTCANVLHIKRKIFI